MDNVKEPMSEPSKEPNSQPQEPQVIDSKAYDEVKNDLFKMKRVASSKDEEIQRLQAQIKEAETNKLKESQQFKELYEASEKDKQELQGKYDGLREAIVQKEKFSKVKDIAKSMGLRDEAVADLEMLDLEPVVTQVENGSINVHGADRFVEQIKETRPHWFMDSAPPNINNAGNNYVNPSQKTYSPSELLGLQKSDPAEYQKAIKEGRVSRA